MTVPLDTVNDIRSMDAAGRSRSEIARVLHASRNTVAKYADMEDMSPAAPTPQRRGRPALEGNEEWIAGVLEADLGAPRKQRRTARRIHDRLVAERGYAGSWAAARRFVRELRLARAAAGGEGYLKLEWAPGTRQVDFGNLRAPAAMVLDNAAEAGRMVRGEVTESRPSSQLRAHYSFKSRYRDPYSGNEKGSVENAVGFLWRNLLVPVPAFGTLPELKKRARFRCSGCSISDALFAQILLTKHIRHAAGQRGGRVVLQDAEKGIGGREELWDEGRGQAGHLQVHRALLQ